MAESWRWKSSPLTSGNLTSRTRHAGASGSISDESGRVKNLAIAGAAKGSPASRTVYDLNGYGTLVVLDDTGRGIVALKAHLSKAYGSRVVVDHLSPSQLRHMAAHGAVGLLVPGAGPTTRRSSSSPTARRRSTATPSS